MFLIGNNACAVQNKVEKKTSSCIQYDEKGVFTMIFGYPKNLSVKSSFS